MVEVLRDKPFLVAIFAGTIAQMVKVLSFLLIEKKVNYRRFVQADGTPNMHTTTLSALGMAVGFKDGFGSILFVLALCVNVLVCVDTLNVKNAASRQAEVVEVLFERLRKKKTGRWNNRKQRLSYTPIDVFTGVLLGILFALFIF